MNKVQIERNPQAKREMDGLEFLNHVLYDNRQLERWGKNIDGLRLGIPSGITMLMIFLGSFPDQVINALSMGLMGGVVAGSVGSMICQIEHFPRLISATTAANEIIDKRDYSLINNYSNKKQIKINKVLSRILNSDTRYLEALGTSKDMSNEQILQAIKRFEKYIAYKRGIISQYDGKVSDLPIACSCNADAAQYGLIVDGIPVSIDNCEILFDIKDWNQLSSKEEIIAPIKQDVASAEQVIDKNELEQLARQYAINKLKLILAYRQAQLSTRAIEDEAVTEITEAEAQLQAIDAETAGDHAYTLYIPERK